MFTRLRTQSDVRTRRRKWCQYARRGRPPKGFELPLEPQYGRFLLLNRRAGILETIDDVVPCCERLCDTLFLYLDRDCGVCCCRWILALRASVCGWWPLGV